MTWFSFRKCFKIKYDVTRIPGVLFQHKINYDVTWIPGVLFQHKIKYDVKWIPGVLFQHKIKYDVKWIPGVLFQHKMENIMNQKLNTYIGVKVLRFGMLLVTCDFIKMWQNKNKIR